MVPQTRELQSVQKDYQLDSATTAAFSSQVANTDGTVGVQTGYLKGVITGINAGSVDVKIAKHDVSNDVWTKS